MTFVANCRDIFFPFPSRRPLLDFAEKWAFCQQDKPVFKRRVRAPLSGISNPKVCHKPMVCMQVAAGGTDTTVQNSAEPLGFCRRVLRKGLHKKSARERKILQEFGSQAQLLRPCHFLSHSTHFFFFLAASSQTSKKRRKGDNDNFCLHLWELQMPRLKRLFHPKDWCGHPCRASW